MVPAAAETPALARHSTNRATTSGTRTRRTNRHMASFTTQTSTDESAEVLCASFGALAISPVPDRGSERINHPRHAFDVINEPLSADCLMEGVSIRPPQLPNQGCGRPPKRIHPDPRRRRCSRPRLPDAPAAQPSRPHVRLRRALCQLRSDSGRCGRARFREHRDHRALSIGQRPWFLTERRRSHRPVAGLRSIPSLHRKHAPWPSPPHLRSPS